MKENTREEGEGLIKTAQFKPNFYYNSLSICQEEEASYHSMREKGLIIFICQKNHNLSSRH